MLADLCNSLNGRSLEHYDYEVVCWEFYLGYVVSIATVVLALVQNVPGPEGLHTGYFGLRLAVAAIISLGITIRMVYRTDLLLGLLAALFQFVGAFVTVIAIVLAVVGRMGH